MAITTVGEILRRAKLILQEITQNGTRWTNEELLGWLNEAYQAVVAMKPDASALNAEMACAAGTKQTIPADGHRLLDVVRNTAPAAGGLSVMPTTRAALDATRRGWHGETRSVTIEQFVFDDHDPRHFYVYPPAADGAKLEIIYSSVPVPHAKEQATTASTESIRLGDSYAPALVDYILFRAYSKDAEHAANLNRAQMHNGAFITALGAESQAGVLYSPNQDLRAKGQPA